MDLSRRAGLSDRQKTLRQIEALEHGNEAAPRILDLLRTAPAGEKMALTVLRAGKLYEMEYVVPAR